MDEEEIRYIIKEKEMLENDKLFLKFGVENVDIAPIMERLGMDETDVDLTKIKQEWAEAKAVYCR